MGKPDYRLVASPKEGGTRVELAAFWQSDRFPNSFSGKMGGTTPDGKERKVYIVVEEGGTKTKVALDSHYINLWKREEQTGNEEDF